MKTLVMLLLAPSVAMAQLWSPTVFPKDAAPLASETLQQRLTGKSFLARTASGSEMRLRYEASDAFVDIGNSSDSGKWRVEGSSVCVDWRKFTPSCSEIRQVGDTLYAKRASSGEIVVLEPK